MLTGELPRKIINYLFINEYYNFFNELYSPVHLNRFFKVNINKFLKIKPIPTDAEIRK